MKRCQKAKFCWQGSIKIVVVKIDIAQVLDVCYAGWILLEVILGQVEVVELGKVTNTWRDAFPTEKY